MKSEQNNVYNRSKANFERLKLYFQKVHDS